MKIQGEYLLREAGGSYFLLPAGQTLASDSRMMQLNETGAFLWKHLEQGASPDALLKSLEEEYPEVPAATLERDVGLFLAELRERRMLAE